MAQRGSRKTKRKEGLAHGLSAEARAVMKVFERAKYSAPGFLISCGIFPEISEAATDRLHSIVHDLAESLGKKRQMRELQRLLQALAAGSQNGEALDQIDTRLTAVLAAEATAAYLFGLAAGLAIRSLPTRLGS